LNKNFVILNLAQFSYLRIAARRCKLLLSNGYLINDDVNYRPTSTHPYRRWYALLLLRNDRGPLLVWHTLCNLLRFVSLL